MSEPSTPVFVSQIFPFSFIDPFPHRMKNLHFWRLYYCIKSNTSLRVPKNNSTYWFHVVNEHVYIGKTGIFFTLIKCTLNLSLSSLEQRYYLVMFLSMDFLMEVYGWIRWKDTSVLALLTSWVHNELFCHLYKWTHHPLSQEEWVGDGKGKLGHFQDPSADRWQALGTESILTNGAHFLQSFFHYPSPRDCLELITLSNT